MCTPLSLPLLDLWPHFFFLHLLCQTDRDKVAVHSRALIKYMTELHVTITNLFINPFSSIRRTVRHPKKVKVKGLGLNISYLA